MVVEARRFQPQVGNFLTAKDAYEARVSALARMGRGEALPTTITCLAWRLDYMERRRKKVEVSTARDYDGALAKWWTAFDLVELRALQPEHLEDLQTRMEKVGLSLRTRRKVWNLTVAILRDAVRKQKLTWSPADAVDAPLETTKPRPKIRNSLGGSPRSWPRPSTRCSIRVTPPTRRISSCVPRSA